AFLAPRLVRRMCRAYGTRIERIIGTARRITELGDEIGPGLHEAELEYLRAEEWARCAEDVLWRRSKLGLESGPGVAGRINRWLAAAR
ncbi:glycerol-3-phosphate dehydrogenase, partial [mine drainage metagenome]